MAGPGAKTPAEKRAALVARDVRRRELEESWARVGAELQSRFGEQFRVSRRDHRIVLAWSTLVPLAAKAILVSHGVIDLFTLEMNDDASGYDTLEPVAAELCAALDAAGLETRGYSLTEHHTGPLARVGIQPTPAQATEADQICAAIAQAHRVEAGWVVDLRGPLVAMAARCRQQAVE